MTKGKSFFNLNLQVKLGVLEKKQLTTMLALKERLKENYLLN